ncbi:MAG: glutamate-cysteine ligase family protein [Synechococcales cyanobacterium]
MGQEISSHQFSAADFHRFAQSLHDETEELLGWLTEQRFARGRAVAGFELEACLMDSVQQPHPINQEYLAQVQHPLVVPELAQFNVELNGTPQPLTGSVLRSMHGELAATWNYCQDQAQRLGSRLIMIGILPTLHPAHLTLAAISPMQRYYALNEQILQGRQGMPIQMDIGGWERFTASHPDIMLEAATTSFQIHIQVDPEHIVRYYNAAQLVAAVMVGVSANSPYFCGVDLWAESRIPVFEQSIDSADYAAFGRQPRVSFGQGYLSHLGDYFRANRDSYPPLLPVDLSESRDPLAHLRLHNGTIWQWNRPLIGFDEHGIPHVRLEHRAVPAGPTVADMIANAALFYGLVAALASQADPPEEQIPFACARRNFYRVAEAGLGTTIEWLDNTSIALPQLLLDQLIPLAEQGLAQLQIDPQDRAHYLGIMEERVASGQTGAAWQRAFMAKHGRDPAHLTQAYWQRQESGSPVHTWEY